MLRTLIVCALSVVLVIGVGAPRAFAAPSDVGQEKTHAKPNAARRHLTTIVFAGLAGAVLGLSTLSFYGRPQDHLANVPGGAAVGIIIGATYTTYKAATEPRDFYTGRDDIPDLWAQADRQPNLNSAVPQFGFSFSFE